MANMYTNNDGLTRRYGGAGIPSIGNARKTSTYGAVSQIVIDFDYTNLPGFDEDAGGGSTPDSFSELQAHIPAGSYIKSATLVITEAFTGTSGTLTIGTYQKDGTVIDADGIDAAIAQAAMGANAVVACDGDQVGGVVGVGANNAYVLATTGGTVTGGAGRLVIDYITV